MALYRLAAAIAITATVLPAQRVTDLGAVSPDQPLDRMILVLKTDREPLDRLLEAQQNPASPEYHRWLTPEEYGRRFGVSQRDLDRIAAWLARYGFQVEEIPEGRNILLFSGSASQVARAFRTEIRRYRVNGEMHQANAAEPEIPEALAGVVAGVASLHDFHSRPTLAEPQYASGGAHYLSPADFAAVYDVKSLYAASLDGNGRSIAVVGRSNLKLSDVQSFRRSMGLPVNDPAIILNGRDPGVLPGSEQMEATLDVEWAGAVAPRASVKFVVSASTASSDGVALSAQYIVNRNLPTVMTTSFALCEAAGGSAYAQFWSNLWAQAAAQGITALVSSGDSGAAGCDPPSASSAARGPGVNALCTPANAVCVGGTQFEDAANPGLYWGPNGSALGYIPESVWNSSAAVSGGSQLWAGGGGASIYFPKPSWQTGTDVWRRVPDVALAASPHDGYLIYMNGGLYSVGGTSAAAPAWAGIMALVVQQTGSSQGNANPNLYALAGSSAFHDILTGTNSVPAAAGFAAAAGYDSATGLGSPDAFNLVQRWKDGAVPFLRLSVGTAALALPAGSSAILPVSTTVGGGYSSPVTLSAAELPRGMSARWSLSSLPAPGAGSSKLTLTAPANVAPGVYTIIVRASGAGAMQMSPVRVTVAPHSARRR